MFLFIRSGLSYLCARTYSCWLNNKYLKDDSVAEAEKNSSTAADQANTTAGGTNFVQQPSVGAGNEAPPAWLTDVEQPPPPTAQQMESAQQGATNLANAVDDKAWAQAKSGNVEGAGQTVAVNMARQQAQAQADQLKRDLGELPKAWKIMKFLNISNAILCGACIVDRLSNKDHDWAKETDLFVIGVFVFMFATILFCYETVGLFGSVAYVLAENFGLLYTIPGRLFFMLMTNVIIFSLTTNFAYAVGVIGCCIAFYNAACMVIYPAWTAKMIADQRRAAEFASH